MHRWLLILLATGVLAVGQLAAQERDERLDLEVYVADARGLPASGLGRKDFDLLVEGKRVEPAYFREVRQGSAPETDPVVLVLYVDDLHVTQLTRNQTLEKMWPFLRERLRRGDQAMLVSYNGRIRVHQKPTGEWRPLERAIDQLMSVPTFGHIRESRELKVLSDMMRPEYLRGDGLSGSRCSGQLNQMAELHAEDVLGQVRAGLSGLSTFVSTLVSLPGRKVVFHLSDGIAGRPGATVNEFLRHFCGGQSQVAPSSQIPQASRAQGTAYYDVELEAAAMRRQDDVSELVEDIARRANAFQVTFYPLEAGAAQGLTAADMSPRRRRGLSQRIEEIRRASRREVLSTMATSTGGRAVFAPVDLGVVLDSIGRDFDTYYQLGYRLLGAKKSKDVAVGVRLRPAGLEARYRKSLHHGSLEEELAGRTQAALLYGVVANPLEIGVDVGDKQPLDGLHMVPIWLRIPVGKLTLEPKDGGYARPAQGLRSRPGQGRPPGTGPHFRGGSKYDPRGSTGARPFTRLPLPGADADA